MAKNTFSAKAKTPLFKGAFVRVFQPEIKIDSKTGEESRSWNLTAILPKGTDISSIEAAIKDAAEQNWGKQAAVTMKHKSFKHPIKSGDDFRSRKDGELYEGFAEDDICFKIASKSKAPGIVDRLTRKIADENGATLVDKKNDVYDIIESNRVYSGCYFLASFTAMAYDRADGCGISLLLENLQLVKQGPSLGGGGSGGGASDASSDFGVVEGADSEDLDNLLGV